MTFALYLLAAGLYASFIAWCLAPIIRRRGRAWLRRVRVGFGLYLIAAGFLPLLAIPIFLPVSMLGEPFARHVQAALFFVHTLPAYVENVRERSTASARIVDVRYPIEIGGVRYAPVVRTACIHRQTWSVDKGVSLHFFGRYPTADGGQLLARAGEAIVAIDHARAICSDVLRGPINLDRLQQREVFVVRGEADKIQFYSLSRYPAGRLDVDDIFLHPPEIVSIAEAPARDVISLDVLWPMWCPFEYGTSRPDLAWRYMKLPAGVNACVEFVSWDSFAKPPQVRKSRKTQLPKGKAAVSSAYCREVLAQHLGSAGELPVLAPQP